ncbi:DUF2339 domain-containing protein [Diaphorobacter sp. HDW4A]|uniref:DUF2339 domain-containing protein n=1 Tax=Diaphorobacter sp. HDW4A TaxID=2714924 RepID=UPI00140C1433|nr:DUF2339 domain-containing protein [Diaphorobacter sp. HDW4A]QIL83386.1 DUF2339 domain-containing protein [Diaphorobacter sp. HDW4A]
MQWILMVVGGLLGALDGEMLAGALLGLAIGLVWVVRGLRRENDDLSKKLDVMHKRLGRVERFMLGSGGSEPMREAQEEQAVQATAVTQEIGEAPSFEFTPETEPEPMSVPERVAPATPVSAVEQPTIAAVQVTGLWQSTREAVAASVERAVPEAVSATETAAEIQASARQAEIVRKAPPVPSGPSIFERAFLVAKGWLFGGNTVLRIGVVLLFIGLAFLLRYASERVSLPVEYRYAGVAFAAFVLLAIGWRLREKRTAYGLILQGTGIAVLYLTIFAAMRLHPLISPSVALVLLIVVTACLAMLAVLQSAMGLAVVAVLGGFAAPILTSTGSGNHVALFSYFALLNAGIFAIAWFRAWRLLNLIGFLGTFGIGFAWGMRAYKPELFASTEPFLILFFLMYVGIGLLFARRKLIDAATAPQDRHALLRWSARQADYIDATVLFGPPIVGFGLQCAVIGHIEFGMAFSALALGLFYMVLARVMHGGAAAKRTSLLMEVYLALGVIFGTLAIPLALDARWTAAAWAVEGAGIFWLGLRQQRLVARIFALFLQVAAACAFLSEIRLGGQTLLDGAPLGALMVGAAFLFSFLQLRRTPRESLAGFEPKVTPALAVLGLSFLYLIAPLCFGVNYTAMAWAVAGLATLYAGLRLQSRTFLFCAFGVQILGAILFFLNMDASDGQGGVLASGWQGLLSAMLIGLMMIAGMVLAVRDPHVKQETALVRGVNLVLLLGLVFVNLAVLFVLPWRTASAVWAASGLLILWLGLLLGQRLSFYFGIALQVFGGAAFLSVAAPALLQSVASEGLRPLAHSGFWTPALVSIAALVGAWRLRKSGASEQNLGIGGLSLHDLSTVLMLWGAVWWAFAVLCENVRFVPLALRDSVSIAAASLTAAIWGLVARRVRWRELASLCLALAPCGLMVLLSLWMSDLEPFADWRWAAWPLLFGVHLLSLRLLPPLLPARLQSAAHVLGCWLLIGVLALEMRHLFALLAEQYNAWRWLGWALVPSVYLLLMASRLRLPWPVRDFAREYRLHAAAPVALVMLCWFWLANLFSDGAAQPLPFVPLVNPLEIGLLIVLFALYRWSANCLDEVATDKGMLNQSRQVIAGASIFALLTMMVCRAAHHLFGVPFDAQALGNSMLVQAGLSLVWTLFALALTIAGTRLVRRDLWMTGAVLVGIVVVKMFFIELGNSGSLERIISFIGVGVLLLVVGYFSPLPPRREQAVPSDQPEKVIA